MEWDKVQQEKYVAYIPIRKTVDPIQHWVREYPNGDVLLVRARVLGPLDIKFPTVEAAKAAVILLEG